MTRDEFIKAAEASGLSAVDIEVFGNRITVEAVKGDNFIRHRVAGVGDEGVKLDHIAQMMGLQ